MTLGVCGVGHHGLVLWGGVFGISGFMHLLSLFEQCSHVVSMELLQKLQDQKCAEKGNVREHFNKLHTIKEQLS